MVSNGFNEDSHGWMKEQSSFAVGAFKEPYIYTRIGVLNETFYLPSQVSPTIQLKKHLKQTVSILDRIVGLSCRMTSSAASSMLLAPARRLNRLICSVMLSAWRQLPGIKIAIYL